MWIIRGLRKGVITSRYPGRIEDEEIPPYVPVEAPPSGCPFGAVVDGEVDRAKCIYCGLCDAKFDRKVDMSQVGNPLSFRRSLHVFFMDVGTCGLCNREVSMLTGPHYDVHRLGIFLTPTPKHADVILVAGCPTANMARVLKEAYEIMPEPKRVVVMGSCSQGAVCDGGVEDHVPVDGRIHGCPPSPIAVIDGLLKVVGRSEI